MIYHRDYVIKLIQQFIIFLATLLKLKGKEDPSVLIIEIEKAYSFYLGYPRDLLFKMDVKSLIQLLTYNETFQFERLGILGILFLEESNLYKEFREIESSSLLRQKALDLLNYCVDKIYDVEFKNIILEHIKNAQYN